MTSYQLNYVRFLLRQIKDLYIETQAMSVVLDTAKRSIAATLDTPWRSLVQDMKNDPVFCSSVEANFGPYFLRLEQAMQDEHVLKTLSASGREFFNS